MAKVDEGVAAWNQWRKVNPRLQPDLTHMNLSGRELTGIDFRGVGLYEADLSHANLTNANLRQARLVRTNFEGADLSGARIYGVSAWDIDLTDAIQRDLIVTPGEDSVVTVADLELAQFVYLLITNRNLRHIIDTITSKVVLLLGRFKPDRKPILDIAKAYLRGLGYVPVLFDFQPPASRDLTETVSTLAQLARFVLVDLTDPSSVPHELMAVVPHVRVPVVTLIENGHTPYAMFGDLVGKYHWLLPPRKYADASDVLNNVLPSLRADAERCRERLLTPRAPPAP